MSASALLLLLYTVSGMPVMSTCSRDASRAYSNNKHFFPPRVRSGDTPMIPHSLKSATPTTHKPPRPPWLPGVPERDLATVDLWSLAMSPPRTTPTSVTCLG
ncbi:hypothetical protein EDB92DRAFT_2105361 [Lactarius akahatsu]|uniref:Secreted protein n=1 Tax=Lactarius akahatsu TaxID=416441 RepID=A0AAD4LFB1_9AGAM|nr:hypothetical protein EDB92DRAFT_2105361 [Lactarius akahatsu]